MIALNLETSSAPLAEECVCLLYVREEGSGSKIFHLKERQDG